MRFLNELFNIFVLLLLRLNLLPQGDDLGLQLLLFRFVVLAQHIEPFIAQPSAGITTADGESAVEAVSEYLQTDMSYEGSPQEKQARVYLAGLGIDYEAITKEEFVTLMDILAKSKKLQIRQAGGARVALNSLTAKASERNSFLG